MPTIEEDIEEIKEPQFMVKSINEVGELVLLFSEEMLLEDIFGEYNFASTSDKQAEDDEEDWRVRRLRLLQESQPDA